MRKVGIAATVSGAVLSLAFFWQYCLWKKYRTKTETPASAAF